MTITINLPTDDPLELTYPRPLSPEEFWRLCALNPDLSCEREENGKVTVMSPVGFKSGERESIVNHHIRIWSYENDSGRVASSSTGFTLPNGSVRSPDAAWVSDERLAEVTEEELERFPPLVPDFIVEIRSKTDRLPALKQKMREQWVGQGVRLAWLIDPLEGQVTVYRESGETETVTDFSSVLSGEAVLPGFEFDLSLLKV